MNNLSIRRLPPRLDLQEYIRDIWVFESRGNLSDDELQIIPPNGSVKLMLNYEGQLVGRIGHQLFLVPQHRLSVIGITDCPTIASFNRDKPFGCVSIELNPAVAYRLFNIPQHDLRNTIVPLGELIGTPAASVLEERLYLAPYPTLKAALLMEHLTGTLSEAERDATFEHCTASIINARGLVSLETLSRETGHSDRWIRAKFADRLGVSPKTFASIVRFHSSFQALLHNKFNFLQSKHFTDQYYDQAHFIKEFKRFIGFSPARYTALHNEVGESIYIS